MTRRRHARYVWTTFDYIITGALIGLGLGVTILFYQLFT